MSDRTFASNSTGDESPIGSDDDNEQTECPECGHPKRVIPDPREGEKRVMCTDCKHRYDRWTTEIDRMGDSE